MIKPASSACNLRCEYCFYRDEADNRAIAVYPVLSFDIVEKLFRKAFSSATYVHFIFQGGEPALVKLEWYERFMSLEKIYNTRNIRVDHSLQTNGTCIDEKWAQFLQRHRFFVGISFDGNPAINNRQRPYPDHKGSSREVVRGLLTLQNHGVPTNLLIVVTNLVADNVQQIWQWLDYHHITHIQCIPCIDPLGGVSNTWLHPRQYGKFLIQLFDLWITSYWSEHPISVRLFENFLGICLGIEPEACDMKGHCSKQYVIEGDGSIFPCDFYCLDEWKLGNINSTSFQTLSKGDVGQMFLHRLDYLPEECKTCRYQSLCRNGCPRYRDENNRFRFCESYRMFFDQCLEEIKVLACTIQPKSSVVPVR